MSKIRTRSATRNRSWTAVLLWPLFFVAATASAGEPVRLEIVHPTLTLMAKDVETVMSQGTVAHLRMGSAAARRFAEITRSNIGKLMQIVTDGRILSRPVIRSEIADGDLTGGMVAMEDARIFAQALAPGGDGVEFQIVQDVLAPSPADIESVSAGDWGKPVVRVQLKPAMSTRFAELTRNNIGKPLQIVFGERILAQPIIRSVIEAGAFVVGVANKEEAEALVEAMRPEP